MNRLSPYQERAVEAQNKAKNDLESTGALLTADQLRVLFFQLSKLHDELEVWKEAAFRLNGEIERIATMLKSEGRTKDVLQLEQSSGVEQFKLAKQYTSTH